MMVALVSFTHASLSPLVASLDLNVHKALQRGPEGMVLSIGFPYTIQKHIVNVCVVLTSGNLVDWWTQNLLSSTTSRHRWYYRNRKKACRS